MIKKIKLGVAWQRMLALVIVIAVIVYTVYHVTSLFGEDISTIATGLSTETRFVDGKGYIFRDEQVLYSDNGGVADYLKSDGDKVSVGEQLANVYAEGDATAKKSIKYYDNRIALLEQSTGAELTVADLPEVNDAMTESYYALCKLLSSRETGGITKAADALLVQMNNHSLLTDENSVVDDTLATMTSRRDALISLGGKAISEQAPDSGYFYSYVDGFEEYFSMSVADNLTADGFYKIALDAPTFSNNRDKGAYGKLAASSEWQFVMRVGELATMYFKEGNKYTLHFAENGNTSIPMTLAREIEDTEYGGKILFFEANRLPDGFVFDRCQSASIEVSSFAGIYVPRSALHREGGTAYVYVLKGSVVRLRRIDVIYEGSDYILSAVDVKTQSGTPYLDINEILITNGDNLFEGRILD